MSRGRCFLYRHYDANGDLLYIGISDDWTARTRTHRRSSPWFGQVRRITIVEMESRERALAAEEAAIRAEMPSCNMAGTGKRLAVDRMPRSPGRREGPVAQWMDERCDTSDPAARTHVGELYGDFREWSEAHGIDLKSTTAFGLQLHGFGHVAIKDARGLKQRLGIRLHKMLGTEGNGGSAKLSVNRVRGGSSSAASGDVSGVSSPLTDGETDGAGELDGDTLRGSSG